MSLPVVSSLQQVIKNDRCTFYCKFEHFSLFDSLTDILLLLLLLLLLYLVNNETKRLLLDCCFWNAVPVCQVSGESFMYTVVLPAWSSCRWTLLLNNLIYSELKDEARGNVIKITICTNTYRTRKLGSAVNAPTGRVRKKLKFSLLEKQET